MFTYTRSEREWVRKTKTLRTENPNVYCIYYFFQLHVSSDTNKIKQYRPLHMPYIGKVRAGDFCRIIFLMLYLIYCTATKLSGNQYRWDSLP